MGDFEAAALPKGGQTIMPAKATAALTTYEYTVVKFDTAAKCVAVSASSGEFVPGIVQGKVANAGDHCDVVIGGPSFCVLGATLSKGAAVMSGGNGKVIASTTAGQELGFLIDGGVDGDIKPMMITHGGIY